MSLIKEMAYQALPYIERHFLNPPLVNTFLVRNPRKSLLSWYKLNEFPSEEELGFVALRDMFDLLTKERKQPSIVVDADCFQRNPKQTLQAYCQSVGVEFSPALLSWTESHTQQENQHTADLQDKWHQALDSSTSIQPPTEAIGDIRPEDEPMLERALTIYEQLSQYALNHSFIHTQSLSD
ncbi:MAG: hypothetical protein AB4042_20580 [Leptolyngbyaceae cyanobacterium]